ncbi:MAG TPA: flagellar biosynthetic protein FliO [Pseudolabrys sp.]|jgi:hypothetical protein|nr:flagellar biosynthetic protein FliO [Pseudolabrys sp.]
MFDTFGSELPLAARFFIAFLVVLALIGVTAWLVRRFGSSRLGAGGARGRQPRLAVIDAASVDGRRRLVLIRRDNIEHLLMIGGPTDVVIEPNIVRAAARDIGVGRDAPRELGREPAVRAEPTAWPLQPSNEPPPVASPRPSYRAPAIDEPWHAPEPGARARPADSVNGAVPEFSPRAVPEPSPAPAPIERQQPRINAASDRNLAEMAQQLEAALRRAPVPEGRPPVTDALAAPAPHAAPKPADAPRTPAAEFKPRAEPKPEPKFEPKADPKVSTKVEPKVEPKVATKIEPKIEPKFERKPEIKLEPKPEPKAEPRQEPKLQVQATEQPTPKTEAPPLDKDLYDNLEEEMANLLGRPARKS